MKKQYIAGIVLGLIIVFLAVPLGDLYGGVYLIASGGLETERWFLLMQSAVNSFQMIGGILSLLSGLALIFSRRGK